LDFVGEDDEDQDADDLLCDWAPGALQGDGSMGLMDSDGTHVLVAQPPANETPTDAGAGLTPRSTTSYKMSRGPTEQQRRAMMLGRAAGGGVGGGGGLMMGTEDPCLSDSWHTSDTSTDSSIAALRSGGAR
jgi:hypothetical protein